MTTAIVTASSLNLRPEPSTRRRPLAKLRRGTKVEILGREGRWYRVRGGRRSGFVHGDYLRLLDPAPASGFLRDRDDLTAVPLEAPEEERIRLAHGAPWMDKHLAGIWNRRGGLLASLSAAVDLAPAAAVATLSAESSGAGFTRGRLKVRFEAHVFGREWGGRNRAKFNRRFRFEAAKPWRGHEFRPSAASAWKRFHGRQDGEWSAFSLADRLSPAAAVRSISMGAPQIMGFNAARIGYDSAREMLTAFEAGPRAHVLGLFDFLKGPGENSDMLEDLRRGDFEAFAVRYNGPGRAAEYGARIRRRFEAFSGLS